MKVIVVFLIAMIPIFILSVIAKVAKEEQKHNVSQYRKSENMDKSYGDIYKTNSTNNHSGRICSFCGSRIHEDEFRCSLCGKK